jgi:hypothetical protein
MRTGWLAAAVLAWCSSAGAQFTAALSVAESQDPGLWPYRSADLLLTNSTGGAIEAVLLRPAGGGPTVQYRLALPPGQESRQTVALPAIWPVQHYAVAALGAGASVAGETAAEITWPADLVTTDAFLDEGFAFWRDRVASWPTSTRRNTLLLAGMLAAASAAVLFVRRPAFRAACLLGAAALAALLVPRAPGWPEPVEARTYVLRLHGEEPAVRVESFVVLSARRTAAYRGRAGAVPYPVYSDRASATGDDALVDPVQRSIRLTVRPQTVRVVRPAAGDSPTEGPSKAGTVRRSDGGAEVLIDFACRRGLLVRDDLVWAWPGESGNARRALVRDSSARPIGLAHWGGTRELNEAASALVRYWRQKHRQPGQTYLLEFAALAPAGVRLDVVRLQELPATTPSAGGLPATEAAQP